jgi:repressor LexA
MISERLKTLRENTKMNKKEFAAFLGMKYTTYNNYETGSREPSSDFLIMLSKKFDISIDYLMGLSEEREPSHYYTLKTSEFEHIKKYRALDEHGVAVVNWILNEEYSRSIEIKENSTEILASIPYAYDLAASAGIGEYAMDIAHFEAVGLSETPPKGTDFLVSVSGNSMEPKFSDGDKVYIRRQEFVNEGEIGLFFLDGNVYIKKQGFAELLSLNPDYAPLPIAEYSSFKCFGKVLGKCHCKIIDL